MRRNNRPYFKPRSIRRLERKSRRNVVISVIVVLIAIFALLNWGLPLFIGSLSIFNKLKPVNSEKSVVEDATLAPPVLSIPFEATNSSSIKISGYSIPKSKVEIYIDDELKTTVDTRDDGSFTTDNLSLSLSTNNIYSKTVDENNKKSLASKTIKLIYSNEKPKLDLSEPQENLQIKGGDKKVRVSGKTDPNNSVTVNGSTVILNGEGGFSIEVPLNDGDNLVVVLAINNFGNSNRVERKVNYQP